MTVASRAVVMAVMTEARTTDVELKGHISLTISTDVGQGGQTAFSGVEQGGHTSLTISDVRQTSHSVAVEEVDVLSCDAGGGGDVLVVASDGGDVVAGVHVTVGGGGVMMVLCGHAELSVWKVTSARCNQRKLSFLKKQKSWKRRPSNVWVVLPCKQYLTRCSQEQVCRVLLPIPE